MLQAATTKPKHDDLGKLIIDDAVNSQKHSSLFGFFKQRQGKGNFTTLDKISHPAKRLLQHIGKRGAPVIIKTAPWTAAQKQTAINRGPHKSAHDYQEFLRDDMAGMVRKAIWTVLPFKKVQHLKNLRIAPIGVVPQHERRPRPVVDYSFNGLNDETLKLSPQESMQFGRCLERIITQVVRADPRYGPVKFIKIDLADGFYRVFVRTEDIPKLGVAFPSLDGEEPLVAFPLALPMGWTESPPYFCAVTETIADVANQRILHWRHPPLHKLDHLANSLPAPAASPDSGPLLAKPTISNLTVTRAAVASPTLRDPLLPQRQRILAAIDIFVDDFISAAQGSSRRLNKIRRILMGAIDDVLRPLDENDLPHRTEPISVSKLRNGDASWQTIKKVLGWVIDSVAMTLTLPSRRLARLAELLASIPPTQHRLAINKWHSLLGELRSMAIALPGARGLFSSLQAAIRTRNGTRLRLDQGFHNALADLRWINKDLASRPTKLQELVPSLPTLLGAHDASGYGAGGVWFPGPTAHPRQARVKSIDKNGNLRRHRLTEPRPILWRSTFPSSIQERLVTDNNLTGDINNSDLELSGSLFHQEAAVQCYDIRERTTKAATDNIATMYWSRKGSTTTTGPPATLLRMAAIHQRHHRYLRLTDYLEGKRNNMADDASRLTLLTDQQLLTHFNSAYPQTASWVLWTPTQQFYSAVILALRRRTSLPELFLQEPPPPTATGGFGAPTVPASDWILPFKSMPIPSQSFKSSSTATALAPLHPAVAKSDLAPWKMPYAALAKRLRQWGPQTHA